MNRIRLFLGVTSLLLMQALGGCGGAGTVTPTVGTTGGTVAGPSGGSVVIPAGALSATTSVAIAPVSSGFPPLGATSQAQGEVLAFTPHGQSFAVPVMVTVPFTGGTGSGLRLMTADPGGSWSVVSNAVVSGNAMTASVNHFSYFAVVNPADADGGSGGPLDGTWVIMAKVCNGNPVDMRTWPTTTFTITNTTGQMKNVYCTIAVTLTYPAAGAVEWTIGQTVCPAVDGGNSAGGDHHSATYTLVGSTATLTEAVTPAGEYGCANGRQVTTLIRQ